MGCSSGAVGTGRGRAAGAGRKVIAGRERTTVPGIKRAPCPVAACSCETRQPRWVRSPMVAGRPTVRKAQFPSGRRMTQEANADTRKRPAQRPAAGAGTRPPRHHHPQKSRLLACSAAAMRRGGAVRFWERSGSDEARDVAARRGHCRPDPGSDVHERGLPAAVHGAALCSHRGAQRFNSECSRPETEPLLQLRQEAPHNPHAPQHPVPLPVFQVTNSVISALQSRWR